MINSIYWHTHRSTVDQDDYQEYDMHNNNAKNNVALKILPDDELECYSKVRCNHKNEVDGRLYTKKQF